MKVAIVGSGVSGLTCAYLLHKKHDVTIFEGSKKAGGHVNTVQTEGQTGTYNVDTGFIVFNRENYPNFGKLLKKLDVKSQITRMGFSVQSEKLNLEYSGESITGLFGHFRNLIDPKHWMMVRDILRFHDLAKNKLDPDETVDSFLEKKIISDKGSHNISFFLWGPHYGHVQLRSLVNSLWSSSPIFYPTIKCCRQTIARFGELSKGVLELM